MRELTTLEARETAGGLLPVLATILVSIIGSCTYDPIARKKEDSDSDTP